MERNYWLQRIFEASILSIPCFFLANWIIKFNLNDNLDFFEKFFKICSGVLIGSILAGFILNIVKLILFEKTNNQAFVILKKLIENVVVDLYILLIVSLCLVFLSIVYLLFKIGFLNVDFIIKKLTEISIFAPIYLIIFVLPMIGIIIFLSITALIFFEGSFLLRYNEDIFIITNQALKLKVADLCLQAANVSFNLAKRMSEKCTKLSVVTSNECLRYR
ncbi:hypothetical protein [Funiculus sociatus]|uniref:hypothetical protein n=1 Tax=Funiculus sociatus TaxID=450527 RepID=UPI003D64AD8E